MPQKNVALDLLERLLKVQVKALTRTNLVKAKKFDEMLADHDKAREEKLHQLAAKLVEEGRKNTGTD